MTKAELRSKYLSERQKMNEAQCAMSSLSVYHRFFAGIDLSFVRTLHTYIPIPGRNEVDTWMVIDRIRREHSHIRIVLPRVDGTNLRNILYTPESPLVTGSWGLQEPADGEEVPANQIDTVIVPLVAFDKAGYRVGYGKGFYDRFLKGTTEQCQKIGFSHFSPVDSISDIHTADIRLTSCVTPDQIWFF